MAAVDRIHSADNHNKCSNQAWEDSQEVDNNLEWMEDSSQIGNLAVDKANQVWMVDSKIIGNNLAVDKANQVWVEDNNKIGNNLVVVKANQE